MFFWRNRLGEFLDFDGHLISPRFNVIAKVTLLYVCVLNLLYLCRIFGKYTVPVPDSRLDPILSLATKDDSLIPSDQVWFLCLKLSQSARKLLHPLCTLLVWPGRKWSGFDSGSVVFYPGVWSHIWVSYCKYSTSPPKEFNLRSVELNLQKMENFCPKK